MTKGHIIYDVDSDQKRPDKLKPTGENGRYNDYCAVRSLIKWLRAEVIRATELAIAKDQKTFRMLRSRFLGLFGEGWGAEKQLKDIFGDEQHQNGQARRNH